MNATFSQTTNFQSANFPISIINTHKLARDYENFEFLQEPRFISRDKTLGSDSKRLYDYFYSWGGLYGYVSGRKREQIAEELGWTLDRFKRALKPLVQRGYIIRMRGGDSEPNIYLVPVHPSMELDEDVIGARKITLPDHIQRRFDRSMRRSCAENSDGANINHPNISDGANMHHTQEIKAFVETKKEMAWPGPSPIIDQTSSAEPLSTSPLTSTATPEPPAAPDYEMAAPAVAPAAEPHTKSQKSEKKKKRKPISKHTQAMCLRFAHAEKERKASIKDAQVFGEACFWTGRFDKEIDRWLKRRAESMVDAYKTAKKTPSTPGQQPTADQETINQERAKLARLQALEEQREAAFNKLSEDAQQKLINKKIQQLMDSEHKSAYRRMPKENLINYAIERIKIDLAP